MADSAAPEDPCGPTGIDRLNLRIGAIFIILVTSLCGTLFPVVSKRVPALRRRVPGLVFEFAKFFGSGVILATGFIHLLLIAGLSVSQEPATEELGEANTIAEGGCIPNGFSDYPFAFGICLIALFLTFVLELVAFRVGTARLAKIGITNSPHVTGHPSEARNEAGITTDPSIEEKALKESTPNSSQADFFQDSSEDLPAAAQILSVAILEFGVIFHSLIIGLTLAVTGPDEFTTLFIVIIFHQMFEGLGLGTRLAFLQLPSTWSWVPFAASVLYSFITPLGMAIGLGARESLSMGSGAASVASGVLDATSGGILIYTALVELVAHEFIFNKHYHTCSWTKLWFSVFSFALGAGIMALLGKWA